MRLSAGSIANAVAWAIVGLLIVAAILITNRLGFAGLFLLGAVTWLICMRAALDQKVPVWSAEVFKAAMERPRSPEERASADAEHATHLSPLRFYGRCGALLTVIGALGFLWQLYRASSP